MEKDFKNWIYLKEKLHFGNPKPPLVREGDIWWIVFGENIGSEMNGKSILFSRPGIILKKLSHGFYLVVPTTSKLKSGTWYSEIMYDRKKMYACLHQIRTIDSRRLSSKMGRLDNHDFVSLRNAFLSLYG